MSISERTTRAVVVYYISSSTSREFSITFPFLNDASNLVVYHRDSDKVLNKLIYPTEYTVTVNQDGTNNIWGKVSLIEGYVLNVGDTIAIERSIPVSQETTFSNQKVFSSTMDYTIDKITALLQDMQFKNSTLHAPIDENVNDSTLSIGTATERANKFLGFDSLGKVTLVTSAGGDGTDRCLRIPLDESPVPDLIMNKELRAGNLPYFDDAGNLQWMYAKSLVGIEVTIADAVATAKAAEETSKAAKTTAESANATAGAADTTAKAADATAKEAKDTADQALENANLMGGTAINISKTLLEKLSTLPAILAATYNNDSFYTISTDRNTISTSTDGVNWTKYSNSGVGNFSGFGYVNGYLIAGKQSSGNVYYRTIEGSWNEKGVGANGSEYCKHSAAANGVGLWIGDEGSICRTTDGENWTKVFNYERSGYPTYRLNYCGDRWIAVSDSNTGTILTSEDNGESWEQKPFTENWRCAFSDNRANFVAVGSGGMIYSSKDGITWEQRTSATGTYLYGIGFGAEKYIAVGENGTMVQSDDGITWYSAVSPGYNSLMPVVYGNNLFVVAGDGGEIYTSEDADTWTRRESDTSVFFRAGIYAGGQFVLAGYSGTILTSEDGETWERQDSGVSDDLHGITYSKGLYVACGQNGTILTSEDGITWTKQSSGVSNYLDSVAYGNGVFVAVGSGGTILTSEDGVTWASRTSSVGNELRVVTFSGGKFVVSGYNGITLYSSDGINWTKTTSGTSSNFHGLCATQPTTVIAGTNIIRSSIDGFSTYEELTIPTAGTIIFGVYDSNKYVLFSESGNILISKDLKNWKTYTGYSGFNQDGIAYQSSSGKFVIGNENNFTCTIYDSKYTVVKVTPEDIPAEERQFGVIKPKFGMLAKEGLLSADCGDNVYINSRGKIDIEVRQLVAGANITITKNKYTNSSNLTTSKTYDYICGYEGSWVAYNASDVKILHSSDGVSWTEVHTPAAALRGIKYLNGEFVAFGDSVGLYTSSDGITWAKLDTTGLVGYISHIIYGNGVYVILHRPGWPWVVTTTSLTDLSAMTMKELDSDDISFCEFNGREFLICGQYSPNIWRSSNGYTWNTSAARVDNAAYPYWILDLRNGEWLEGNEHAIGKSSDDLVTIRKIPNPSWWSEYKNRHAFGKGVIVVACYNEQSAYSLDYGESWTRISLTMAGIRFLNGRFVAYHDEKLYVSADGITWDTLILPGNIKAFDYIDNKLFVAGAGYIGYFADVISATTGGGEVTAVVDIDSEAFEYIPNPKGFNTLTLPGISGSYWRKAVYGNGKFIINSTTNNVVYSSDGITWTSTFMPGASADWYGTAYGNGVFVSVVAGSTRAAYSTDGISWTEVALPAELSTIPVIAYGNGKFVVLSSQTALVSSDGITWTSVALPVSGIWTLCYGDKFVAVSYGSTKGIYSSDGVTWAETTLPISKAWSDVAYGNGTYIATNDDSNDVIIKSNDGITWEQSAKTSGSFPKIIYGNGIWCMTSANSQTTNLIYSFDGTSWHAPSTTLDNTSTIIFAKGRFWVVPYSTDTLRYSNRVSIYPTLAQSLIGA